MKIVSIGYSRTSEYSSPDEWLKRIRFYTGILEELAKQHQVDSIERINYEGFCQQNGVNYYFIKLKKKVERFPWKMHRLVKKLKPDVVFVNGIGFPLQILQLRLTLGRKAKIFVLHRADKPFRGLKKRLQILADKFINTYLFASEEFGKEWITKGIIRDEKKIHGIMQASSSFLPEDKLGARKKLGVQGQPLYLWVGHLDKNKDPLTVVKAFIQFHTHYPAAKLYMVFQTDELLNEIRKIIHENNASQAIELVGKIPHDELQTWFSSADFILSGSHYENIGIAVVEAMSCGCIPLVTDIVSFRKMLGDCGILYKAGEVDALLNTLHRSLKLDVKAQREKVLARFQKEFSVSAIAQKINFLIGNNS